jgi:cation diffusion facilitator CzcD-associated flavoprotein CzcO
MIAALILDAAQRQSLVALRELGRLGLDTHAVEAHERAPAFASRWCGGSSVVPDLAVEPDAYVEALLRLCGELRPTVVIPAHDGTIELLRARRVQFEAGTSLALAAEPALAAAVDKDRTLEHARRVGLRVPRGVLLHSVRELDPALRETGLPAVIKPVRSWMWHGAGAAGTGGSAGGARTSAGGTGGRADRTGTSMGGARTRVGESGVRVGAVAVLTAEEARDAVAGLVGDGAEVLVQEWLPGDREALSFFYAGGEICARFAQRAERTSPPLGGSSVLRESIPLPADVASAAERLVRELGLEGYSEVEFRRDADGDAALMEINPRLSASVEIAVRAGVPFPRMLFEWASGGEVQRVEGYRVGLRMRWLGGDIAWLRSVARHSGRPDVPARAVAVRSFVSDFARPSHYDYLDWRDPRPALSATRGALTDARRWAARRTRVGRLGSAAHDTEVAVLGAGPYGLSVAAHLSGRGVSHEIFGSAMEAWSEHMPIGMNLKSEGFASNLSDPRGEHTLARFCRESGVEYRDVGLPVSLDVFTAYGRSFQERLVSGLDPRRVELVREAGRGGFELRLQDGQTLRSRRVVVATGLLGCIHIPDELAGLPPERAIHAYDLKDPGEERGRELAVIGAGQSALESAVLLYEAGASVRLIARRGALAWNSDPVLERRSLRHRVRYPKSALGDSPSLRLYADHPLAIHALPEDRRRAIAYSALGPAGSWWLRPRFEGHVEPLLGRTLRGAAIDGERVRLRLEGAGGAGAGGAQEIEVDRVVAGTGYRPRLERVPFLDRELLGRIAASEGTPRLDRSFQSTVEGLHFTGYLAGASFGPVMRFVCGAGFSARQISRRAASS